MNRVIELVGPRLARPPPVDWPSVERSIGSILPVDYKRLVEATGPLRVGGFLGVFAPTCPNPNVELLAQVGARLGALRELKTDHGAQACPYPLWAEPGGLLPWGGTDNGDTLYWLTRGHPDQWTVIVGDTGSEFEEFALPTSDFLVRFISGTLDSSLLPGDDAEANGVVSQVS